MENDPIVVAPPIRLAMVALAALLVVSCASRKDTPGSDGGQGSSLSEQVYPHRDGWKEASSHGNFVMKPGRSVGVCLSCHALKANGGPSSIPDCASCHPLFPHEDGWMEGHRSWVAQNGRAQCSTQCHGFDLGGGLSGIGCGKCHALYPHAQNWSSPEKHGVTAKADGVSQCRICHGEDLTGGTSKIGCRNAQCHAIYPHDEVWAQKAGHGEEVVKNTAGPCATKCHGADLGGGLSGIACKDCHGLYPHTGYADWGKSHGEGVATFGTDSCKRCHGEDLKRILAGKNCFSCHPDYPHPEKTLWIPFVGGHGERIKIAYEGDASACQMCHGTDFKTLKNDKNCFSCHPSYPHLGQAAWREQKGHGSYFLANPRTECQMCHGTDYRGGISKVDCKGCHHPEYPHTDPKWVDKGADSAHAAAFIDKIKSGEKAACKPCHGENYERVLGSNSCIDCHKLGITHQPTMAEWSTAAGHGKFFSKNFRVTQRARRVESDRPGYCSTCHGAPVAFKGDVLNPPPYPQTRQSLAEQSDCYKCHWAYPHVRYVQFEADPNSSYDWAYRNPPGHQVYVGASPLFTDSEGNRPPRASYMDPLGQKAVEATCRGNTDGSCHFGIRGTAKREPGLCALCHVRP